MPRNGVFDRDETVYDDGATEYTDDYTDGDDRTETGYTRTRLTGDTRYTAASRYAGTWTRGMRPVRRPDTPPMPMQSFGPPPRLERRPPVERMPMQPPQPEPYYEPGPPMQPQFYGQPPPPTPIKPRPEPRPTARPRPQPEPAPRRQITAAERAAQPWKWATAGLAALGGIGYTVAFFLNVVCTVSLPGVKPANGTQTAKSTVDVGFRSSDLFAFGAMPNTPWYTMSQGAMGVLLELLVILGGALAFASAIFKLWGAKGRQTGGDLFGSLQCWQFNDKSPPLGSLNWQLWWLGAMSLPAIAGTAFFAFIWQSTSSVAHVKLKTGASPGLSLILAAVGTLALLCACGTSARHAILAAKSADEPPPKKWEQSSQNGTQPTRSDGGTLPPYEPPQPEPAYREPLSHFANSSAYYQSSQGPWGQRYI